MRTARGPLGENRPEVRRFLPGGVGRGDPEQDVGDAGVVLLRVHEDVPVDGHVGRPEPVEDDARGMLHDDGKPGERDGSRPLQAAGGKAVARVARRRGRLASRGVRGSLWKLRVPGNGTRTEEQVQ